MKKKAFLKCHASWNDGYLLFAACLCDSQLVSDFIRTSASLSPKGNFSTMGLTLEGVSPLLIQRAMRSPAMQEMSKGLKVLQEGRQCHGASTCVITIVNNSVGVPALTHHERFRAVSDLKLIFPANLHLISYLIPVSPDFCLKSGELNFMRPSILAPSTYGHNQLEVYQWGIIHISGQLFCSVSHACVYCKQVKRQSLCIRRCYFGVP